MSPCRGALWDEWGIGNRDWVMAPCRGAWWVNRAPGQKKLTRVSLMALP